MFASKSALLILAALICSSFAFSPLAFMKGLNKELGLENDDNISECLAHFVKNSQEETTTCGDAIDSYFNALYEDSNEGVLFGDMNLASIETAGSLFRLVDDIVSGQSFAAGQETADLLKQIATSLRFATNERSLFGNVTINATELIQGLNAQLDIVNGSDLSDCLGDSSQTEVIVKALAMAIKQKNPSEAVSDVMQLLKYLPGMKTTCVDSIDGFQVFAKPIEKALMANATQFFQTVQTNLNDSPFEVAKDYILITADIKMGEDYNAGVTSGKVVQIGLKGIIN